MTIAQTWDAKDAAALSMMDLLMSAMGCAVTLVATFAFVLILRFLSWASNVDGNWIPLEKCIFIRMLYLIASLFFSDGTT